MTALDNDLTLQVEFSVAVRIAQQEDLSELEWQGQFAHYRNLFRRSFREQQKGNRLMLVAECNHYLIGRLFVQFKGNNPQIADGISRGYLYSFHILPVFRRKGVGTKLVQTAEALLQQRGFTQATIAVAKDNKAALRLYKRLNYKTFAETSGQWRFLDHEGNIREVYEPSWLLEKTINLR